jgi:hypothetical protein
MPNTPPRLTILHHVGLACLMLRRSFNNAIIDGALQFKNSLLPLDFWRAIILSRRESSSMAKPS